MIRINFSEKISNKLAGIITNELNYIEEEKEIIVYAFETAILFILGIILIAFLGYAFNALIPTVWAAVFGGLLRKVSGGAHFNSPLKCLIIGSITYALIGVLAKNVINYKLINNYILIFILLVSFLIIAFLAPVDSEAKPIHSKSFKLKLKIFSMVFIIITYIIISFADYPVLSVSAVLGILYQSLTLLPVFNRRGRRWV